MLTRIVPVARSPAARSTIRPHKPPHRSRTTTSATISSRTSAGGIARYDAATDTATGFVSGADESPVDPKVGSEGNLIFLARATGSVENSLLSVGTRRPATSGEGTPKPLDVPSDRTSEPHEAATPPRYCGANCPGVVSLLHERIRKHREATTVRAPGAYRRVHGLERRGGGGEPRAEHHR